MKLIHKHSGFTLIEILIVVTILLSLSILGTIKYLSVVEENNISLDIINARTIAEGIKLAGLSGAIDLNKDVKDASISNDKLSKFIDSTVKPKSKHYGGGDSDFTYSIAKQNITIMANGLEVYPSPNRANNSGD